MDHGTPPEGMECACCFDDIEGGKGGNYVEYRTGEGNPWLPSLFCKMCIEVLIKRQWSIYEETLAKATCKAQQKRMLGDGPPTHVNDKKALSCEEGESVHSLWFVRDEAGEPEIQSAELEGAPQGEARQIWWDEKLAFQFDEDDEEEEAGGGDATPAAGPTASTPPPAPGTAADPPPSTAASPPPIPTATAASAAAATTIATAAGAPAADAGTAKQRGEGEGSAAVPAESPEAASGGEAVAVGPEGTQAGVTPPKVPMENGNPAPAPPVAADAPAAPSVPLA